MLLDRRLPILIDGHHPIIEQFGNRILLSQSPPFLRTSVCFFGPLSVFKCQPVPDLPQRSVGQIGLRLRAAGSRDARLTGAVRLHALADAAMALL